MPATTGAVQDIFAVSVYYLLLGGELENWLQKDNLQVLKSYSENRLICLYDKQVIDALHVNNVFIGPSILSMLIKDCSGQTLLCLLFAYLFCLYCRDHITANGLSLSLPHFNAFF